MDTTEKGDRLENRFYQFLLDQKNRKELVYGIFQPELCNIYKKKKYYCIERKGNVTFDVVLECFRHSQTQPFLTVVFECKNYAESIEEPEITEFSDKIKRIFPNAHKGVLVISSRLQRGAKNVADHRKIAIVKYDDNGMEFVAERRGGLYLESRFIKQFVESPYATKSLKFSAYNEGNFFSSIDKFLASLDPDIDENYNSSTISQPRSAPYISDNDIKQSATTLLNCVGYSEGRVDLVDVCTHLSTSLIYTEKTIRTPDGALILGHANFDKKIISINPHLNEDRERFTIAHEIGHIYLNHSLFLNSEPILENDLIIDRENLINFNYDRLEFQANIFASHLLLPENIFLSKVAEFRRSVGIKDRGHGYIFVDDQPCNYTDYKQFLFYLQSYFGVSRQAIEIKLNNLGMLIDERTHLSKLSFSQFLDN